jgi:F0F1-type ATP synthase assembly protein I
MTRRSDEKERSEQRSGGFGRRGAKAYQWALEAAISVPIAMGLGYWADTRLGTSPWLLFVGVVIGFGALVRGLLRIRRLVEDGADGDAPGSDR